MTEALYTHNAYNIVYGCYRQKMQKMFPRMGAEIRPGTLDMPEMQIAVLEPGTTEGEKVMPAPKDSIKYAEFCKRMSNIVTGRKLSPEACANISAGKLGEKHPLFGKHHSEEHKKRVSESMKGKPKSEETRAKMSAAQMGNKKRLGGTNAPNTCKKISESHKGNKNPAWCGGVSFEPYCPKFTKEFKERVRAFFGYECVECGAPQNGTKLSIHHVNFRKDACCTEDAIPLFVPLCESCHGKTNHNRVFWEYWFTEMITSKYGGKCYFTKEEMTT